MIDALTAADAPAAATLSASFGWPHRAQDWALFIELGQGVAWREDSALLGTAMMIPLDAGHATIGLVQVSPAVQGRGIGRQLTEAATTLGADRALMLHATQQGAGLYARLGFVPHGEVQQWQGQILPRAPACPAAKADLAELCQRDRRATGLDRVPVLRALSNASETVLGRNGYAMRRRFGRGWQIGPLIADTDDEAIALTGRMVLPGFVRLDIPASRTGLAGALARFGLTRVDSVQAMVRGAWPEAPGLFGLSSQAAG